MYPKFYFTPPKKHVSQIFDINFEKHVSPQFKSYFRTETEKHQQKARALRICFSLANNNHNTTKKHVPPNF